MQHIDIKSMEGGFENPVFDSQRTFSAIMNAMARPGTIHALSPLATGPSPLYETSAAVLMTLCDTDTAIWLDPACAQNAEIENWLVFHTGATATDLPDESQFAFAAKIDALPDLAVYAQGVQEYPDRSTTIIVQTDMLSSDGELALSGPGIKDRVHVSIAGLTQNFLDQWRANKQRFPRGVDVIFASPNAIMCLPRTTQINQGAV